MTDKHQVRLGAVQQTLFIPLAARAAETRRKHPVLRDPKAAEMLASIDYDAARYGRGRAGSSPSCGPRSSTSGSAGSLPPIPRRPWWSSAPG